MSSPRYGGGPQGFDGGFGGGPFGFQPQGFGMGFQPQGFGGGFGSPMPMFGGNSGPRHFGGGGYGGERFARQRSAPQLNQAPQNAGPSDAEFMNNIGGYSPEIQQKMMAEREQDKLPPGQRQWGPSTGPVVSGTFLDMPRFGGGLGSPMPMFGGSFGQPQLGNMSPQMPPQFGGGGFGGGMMMGPQMPQFGGGMPRQPQSPFGMPGMFGGMGPSQPMFGGMGFGGPQGMPQFGGGFQPPQFSMPQFGGGLLGFGGGGFGGGMPSNMGPQRPQAKVDAPPQAFDGGGGMMDMRYRGGPVMSPAQRRQREQDMLNMQNMAMRGFGG
jgi:hypothetical protein